jgi:SAM-dependent methyltransferase
MPADCCRFCDAPLQHTFVDLGMSPLCESFVPEDKKNHMEPFYPLHVWVCDQCWLVQLQEYVSPSEIFSEYAYFSSFSESWLAHARKYVDMITGRLGLGADHHVVEIASNDGYLLRNFVQKGIPCTGIEPAANVAKAAEQHGVQSVVRFFGRDCARDLAAEGRQADLIIGNNVLAHVPDLNDFVGGLKILLKPGGVVTMEFPHLERLMEGNQFDTIYHEHFSYLSILAVQRIFAHHGLRLFDVEELKSHGGSLRIFAAHADNTTHADTGAVNALLRRELAAGFDSLPAYARFGQQVIQTKFDILDTLIRLRRNGKRIVGYGAPGKGNTLLNYCAIRTDLLDYTVDRNPYKHGRYCPGTHLPIHPVEKIHEDKPDYLFILPWNLKDEIVAQMAPIRDWGGQFIVPIPKVEIL